MRTMFRLFTTVGTAAVITTGVYFGIVLALLPLLQRPDPSRLTQIIVLPAVVLIPVGVAVWWIFRRLRSSYSPRTARTTAIVFGLFTPVSLGIAFALSLFVGAYAEGIGGYPAFGLAGAIVGIVIMVALLAFVPCSVASCMTRRTSQPHQAQ